jgi:hypothetical protein
MRTFEINNQVDGNKTVIIATDCGITITVENYGTPDAKPSVHVDKSATEFIYTLVPLLNLSLISGYTSDGEGKSSWFRKDETLTFETLDDEQWLSTVFFCFRKQPEKFDTFNGLASALVATMDRIVSVDWENHNMVVYIANKEEEELKVEKLTLDDSLKLTYEGYEKQADEVYNSINNKKQAV